MTTIKSRLVIIERIFGNILAIDALNILCQVFDAMNARVIVDGREFVLHELFDSVILYANGRARDIVLTFFGGPPDKGQWFEGTLLTMLLDHTAYQMAQGRNTKVQKALHWAAGCYN